MKLLVSREQAIKRKLPRYFTGRQCHKGHVCERFTVNWDCVLCVKARNNYRYRNNEKYRKQIIENQRQFRLKHPRKMQKRRRQDYLRHFEAYRARAANRHAKKMGSCGQIVGADIKNQLLIQQFKCKHCGILLQNERYEVDHVIALWKRGPNRPENLQCLCEECHQTKSARDSSEYFAERRRRKSA